MNDKEILAQLKTSYESIQDILDNTRKQITDTFRAKLIETQIMLEENYKEIYRNIKAENDISLYYSENILNGGKIMSLNCLYYGFLINF